MELRRPKIVLLHRLNNIAKENAHLVLITIVLLRIGNEQGKLRAHNCGNSGYFEMQSLKKILYTEESGGGGDEYSGGGVTL